MTVTTEVLRAVTGRLLQHLEERGGGAIEIEDDYYWDVPSKWRYLVEEDPSELTIGQLSFDWAEVTKIYEGVGEPCGYALVWLSAVLRRVGELSSD